MVLSLPHRRRLLPHSPWRGFCLRLLRPLHCLFALVRVRGRVRDRVRVRVRVREFRGLFRRHCLSPVRVHGRDHLGLFLRPVRGRRVRLRRVRGPVLWAASLLPRLRSPAPLLLAVVLAGEVYRQRRLPSC